MLPYLRDKELIDDNNQHFKLKHPKIERNIMLSDLIKLKDDMIEIFLSK
jgi:hypothetical protein